MVLLKWGIGMRNYKTLSGSASVEITEKKSKFIAYAKPIQTEKEASIFISEIRGIHWDAKHNVYAYVLKEGNASRYNDDGEPHGTAGMPILNVLKGMELFNAAVVVTRYFGGVLLGTGGLVRTYSKAAKLAIDAAGVIEMSMCCSCQLSCTYDQYGKILNILSEVGGQPGNADFNDFIVLRFFILEKFFDLIEKKISEVTSGQVKVELLGKEFVKTKVLQG